MKSLILVLVSTAGAAALLCYLLAGLIGLQGAGIGALIALVMCAASFSLLHWARRAKGNALLAAMLGGVAASFALMILSMWILASLWREVLVPATLTALGIYLACRFFGAFEESRAALQ